jgi:hypothetical protein
MNSVSQNCRSAALINPNNPSGLLGEIKNATRIIILDDDPQNDFGEDNWYVINETNGELFVKNGGKWEFIYTFGTAPPGSGITNIENVGGYSGVFKALRGTVADLRSLVGTVQQINVEQFDDFIQIAIADEYKPITLSNVENVPLEVGLGAGAGDPNDLTFVGVSPYPKGSVFIQTVSPPVIWLCQDQVTNTWIKHSSESGVLSCSNVGTGSEVFKQVNNNVAEFRTLNTVPNSVTVTQNTDDLLVSMSPAYVPQTLNKVFNIKDNRDSPFVAPNSDNDSTQGYSKGSIWVRQAISGENTIYICNNASPASAQWIQYGLSPNTTQKDYISWHSSDLHVQTITGAIQDFDFGDPGEIVLDAANPSTHFSTVFDGTRQTFVRAVVPRATSYKVTFNFICWDFIGATTWEALYRVNMIRKSNSERFGQSFAQAVLPRSDGSPKNTFCEVSFIIHEPSGNALSYYFEIQGLRYPGGTPAQNINIEKWAVTFQEL